ncbi:succinate--CoA ligase [ADP-forming] subunit beta 2 [Acrocarpospora pleiomorpha]|uniref:Succinate--CoA ligase [ADP-forming] subunit beta 2 n=1 Tax=Acrocarpospora pleiomorpha TaxID=90975 RepID=A0A5M3XYJ1_9ACTN|nr:ATP-grasp domain-containing protein [Acrocarpospora pleiomorpha]GES26194.1 succinate--CoA ligase [ADP-forming] subunit beta 2 [Acrocarpospora pleiomorpha]
MTKLLEYQVKEILREEGIATPPGLVCRSAAEAREAAAELGGRVFVKAQVAAGDRASAGGVRSGADPAEAEAIAAELLAATIQGMPVEAVLVEAGIQAEWEGYASVSIVEGPPRRVLRFSSSGGTGFDPARAAFQLEFDSHIEPHVIRRELRRTGLASHELLEVTRTLSAMIRCVSRWSAYLLELNPIALTPHGLVALDGKADIDDYSKALIPDAAYLEAVETDPRERLAREYQSRDHRGSFRYVQLLPEGAAPAEQPRVASHSVGGGESMVVLDALAAADLAPTNYCDTSGAPSAEKVAVAAELVAGQPHIEGVLFSTCIANQPLTTTAHGLVDGWERAGWRGPSVVRFAGNESPQARDIVARWGTGRMDRLRVVGEETDEWTAARMLRDLIEDVNSSEEQGR